MAQFFTAERRRWERRALGKDHPKPSRDLNNHFNRIDRLVLQKQGEEKASLKLLSRAKCIDT